MSSPEAHGTVQEKQFIKQLGRSGFPATARCTRLALLLGLQKGYEKRIHWGDIDARQAKGYLMQQIDIERGDE